LGFAELAEGVDGSFAFAGSDDDAVAFVGAAFGGDFTDGGPGGAVAVEYEVVFDGEFKAGAGEFALDGKNGRIAATIGEAFEVLIEGTPTGVEQSLDGIHEIHEIAPSAAGPCIANTCKAGICRDDILWDVVRVAREDPCVWQFIGRSRLVKRAICRASQRTNRREFGGPVIGGL